MTAVLEKLVSRVKLALHHHLSASVYKFMFCFASMPFTFPQKAPKTRPRRTGSKMAISHSEYCHIENASTECLPAASFFFFSTDN